MDELVKKEYPAISLEKNIIFPFGTASLVMEGEEVAKVIAQAHQRNHQIVLLFQKEGRRSSVGVVAQVNRHFELAPTITGVVLEGLKRVKILSEFSQDGAKMAAVEEVEQPKRTQEEEMEVCYEESLDTLVSEEPANSEVDEDAVIRCMPVEARFIAVSLCYMQTQPEVAARWLTSQAEAFEGALARVVDALRQNRLDALQPCDSAEYESLIKWWSTKRRQENVKELIAQLRQNAMIEYKHGKVLTK